MSDPENTHPYQALTPDLALKALESKDFRCDGRLLALNSYENRVYQVGIEDEVPVIAKFYRPARWTRAAIQEEHNFSLELADQEIPIVAPFRNSKGETLHEVFRNHGSINFFRRKLYIILR